MENKDTGIWVKDPKRFPLDNVNYLGINLIHKDSRDEEQ